MDEASPWYVEVLWGSFGLNGEWTPNPNLQMSADEQWLANQRTLGQLPPPPVDGSPTS